MKINCWDYMKCGREVDGTQASTLGVCPAWSFWTFQGKNDGLRGGRYCWSVAGSGREDPACTNAADFDDCSQCSFYQLVMKEEGSNFVA